MDDYILDNFEKIGNDYFMRMTNSEPENSTKLIHY